MHSQPLIANLLLKLSIAPGKRRRRCAQRFDAFGRQALNIAIDLPHESGEHFAGSDFDKSFDSFGDEPMHGFQPLHRSRDLPDERFARRVRARDVFRINIRDERNRKLFERRLVQIGSESFLRRSHQC